jgi:hypothetical protein
MNIQNILKNITGGLFNVQKNNRHKILTNRYLADPIINVLSYTSYKLFFLLFYSKTIIVSVVI